MISTRTTREPLDLICVGTPDAACRWYVFDGGIGGVMRHWRHWALRWLNRPQFDPMQKRLSVFERLVPRFNLPPIPQDKEQAFDLWWRVYNEAFHAAELFTINWRPQESGLYNPEYLLVDWCGCLLNGDRLKHDVLGWALHALEREQGFYVGQMSPQDRAKRLGWKPDDIGFLRRREPIQPEILNAPQAGYFLARIQEWMDARVAYHRLVLRLTFCKADPLALAEPICGDVDRLRKRLADWRDVTVLKQQELFEAYAKEKGEQIAPRGTEIYGCDFITFLKDRGVKSGAISSESVNWLCWLQLASPLSREWEPRECARAVRKIVFGEKFREQAAKWWKKPPPLTYEPEDEGEDFVTAAAKQIVSNEFNEFVEDYVSSELADLKSFTNTLTRQLNEFGIPHSGTRGRPKPSGEVVPAEWENGDPGAFGKALRAVALCRSHSGDFDPEGAVSYLERDDPKGWLAARHVTC